MADTPVTPTPIGSWPTAPQRTDAPATFVTRAGAWVAATPTRSAEMNALATNMNANAVSAFDSATEGAASASAASASADLSESSAATAVGIANYVGAWADQTGAATVPTSVDHEGAFWILLEDVADITAWEPAESDKWARAFGVGQIYERAANVEFVAEDNGKIIEYTSGTFTQTFDAAANLGANWSVTLYVTGTGVITLDPDGSETIDGSSTKAINKGVAVLVVCDGTSFKTISTVMEVGDDHVTVTTGNGHGSTNNKIRRFTTTQSSSGTSVTYADSAANGGSFTINEAGLYSITYIDAKAVASANFGISLNSSELTTSIVSITAADRIGYWNQGANSQVQSVTITEYLSVGDVVRAHTDGNADSSSALSSVFKIRKVGA